MSETEVPVTETAPAATPVVENPQEQPPVEQNQEPERKARGVQVRLDELTREKHEARRERDYWREMALRNQAQPATQAPAAPASSDQPPTLEAHNYDQEAFTRAMVSYEAKQIVKAQQEEAQRAQQLNAERQLHSTFAEKVSKAVETHPDYHDVVNNPALSITKHMAETMMHMEMGPEVAYHLGMNPQEALRISQLPPYAAAAALGRLEASLSKPVQTTRAPAPPPTLGGGSTATKSLEDMSPAEFAAFRNQQLRPKR